MKLVCDRCHSTYSIAEEQFRGKVVTLRCQQCGHVIRAPIAPKPPPQDATVRDDAPRTTSKSGVVRTVAPADGSAPQAASGRIQAGSSRPSGAAPADSRRSAGPAVPQGPVGNPMAGGAARPAGSGRVAVPLGRSNTRALPSRGEAPRPAPAIGKFESDEDGRLRKLARAVDGAPGRPGTDARAAGTPARPAFGADAVADTGPGGDDDEVGPPTQINAFDDLAKALAATAEAQDEWYLSVDGDQRGPFARQALEEEIPKLTGEDVFVWRDGFGDWKPLADVPELDPDLRLAPAPSSGVVRGAKAGGDVRQSPWAPIRPAGEQAPGRPTAAADAPRAPMARAPSRPVVTAAPRPAPASAETDRTEEHVAPSAAARGARVSQAVTRPHEAPAAEPAAPRPVGRERSGAEVVPIESLRERRARAGAEPGRAGGSAAQPLPPPPSSKPLPFGELDTSDRSAVSAFTAAEPTGSETSGAAALPASLVSAGWEPQEAPVPSASQLAQAAAAPHPAPDAKPAAEEELVVAEPSQAVRIMNLQAPRVGTSRRFPAAGTGDDEDELVPTGVRERSEERLIAAGAMVPQAHARTHRILMLAAMAGALASLSLAGVVAYLILGRGTQPQVREIVRVRAPEELALDADRAAARILAEKRFDQTNPSATRSGTGGNGVMAGKRPVARPAAAGGPAAPAAGARRSEARSEGMADFFKSGSAGGAAPGGSNLAEPVVDRRGPARRASDDEIQKAISRQRGTLNVCYNRALKMDSSLKSVRLDMTLKIGISGRIAQAAVDQAEQRNTFLGSCLVDTVKRWIFPATGEDYTAQMPLVLHAN
jgi:predicted Zn finger-like uncharacterized protein